MIRFCPECGTEWNGIDRLCTGCGKDLTFYVSEKAGALDEMAENQENAVDPTIPESLAAYKVEKQQNGKFIIVKLKNSSDMTAIVPDCVEAIKADAFRGSDLLQITLPEGLLKIGDRAFADCKDLDTVNFPESLKIIGEEAFAGCIVLDKPIPKNIRVGKDAFRDTIPDKKLQEARRLEESKKAEEAQQAENEKNARIAEEEDGIFLKSCQIEKGMLKKYKGEGGNIRIPNTVKSIQWYAFKDCSGLVSVTVAHTVKTIGCGAFKDCSGLVSAVLPSGVKCIKSRAFKSCGCLTEIAIPNSVKFIEKRVFEDCSGMIGVTIPNSVKGIGCYAFKDCRALTKVTIPNSVKRIEKGAFSDCSNLTEITIPNSVKYIGKGAFFGCISLKTAKVPSHLREKFKSSIDPELKNRIDYI